MKLKIILILALFLSTQPAWAATAKTIKLKDGTTLIGEITSVANGRYSIKTSNLGVVTVGDEDILSIQAAGAQTSNDTSLDPSSLKQQVQSVQGQIMNDEAIMDSINSLAQDKEIQALLQNQQLMTTIMSFDEQKIESDPAVKELLQREDIQAIIKQIESKITPVK